MERQLGIPPLQAVIEGLRRDGLGYVSTWFGEWTLIQIGIILALLLGSVLLARRVQPAAEAWVRSRDTSLRMMRVYAVLLRRMSAFIFLGLISIALVVMRSVTWASRSYLIELATTLALAWIIIRLAARLIRNRTLASAVAWIGWGWLALVVLGLSGRAIAVLDGLAIHLGTVRISLLLVLQGAMLMIVLTWLANVIGAALERRMGSMEGITPTTQVLVGKIVKIALLVLAFIIALQTVGIDLSALAFFSGAIGLGLGFGLQKVFSNLISGFILLADRSVKPGDVVSVDSTYGVISRLGARCVTVTTRDGRDYLIPNETLITSKVVNWSHSHTSVRVDVTFGVSYQADPHAVRKLAIGAAQTVSRVMSYPAPVCHLKALGDSSLDFVLRFWIDDGSKGVVNVQGEVLLALWDTLKENGVDIPYPHREIILQRKPREGPIPRDIPAA